MDDSELVRRRPADMLSEIEEVEIVGRAGNSGKTEAEIRRLSRVGIGQTLLVEGRPGA